MRICVSREPSRGLWRACAGRERAVGGDGRVVGGEGIGERERGRRGRAGGAPVPTDVTRPSDMSEITETAAPPTRTAARAFEEEEEDGGIAGASASVGSANFVVVVAGGFSLASRSRCTLTDVVLIEPCAD